MIAQPDWQFMRRPVYLWIVLVLLWPSSAAIAVDRSADGPVDFREELINLPYATEIVPRLIPHIKYGRADGRPFLFVPFNGDGLDDLVRADSNGLVVEDLADSNRVLARVSLDAEYAHEGAPAFSLTQCPDLNGDGRAEIVAIGHTENSMAWRVWVLDGKDLSFISTTLLPAGQDIRRDGRWDGVYRHANSMHSIDDAKRPIIILTCNVYRDRDGRGILGIDPLDGRILWRHAVAGSPRNDSVIAGDLDGDGRNEIVLALELSGSPRGRVVNGYLEEESGVLVLNQDGTRRWAKVVSTSPGGCDMIVADTDRDGQIEVIVTHWTTPSPSGGIHVWNMSGELLDRYESEWQLTGLELFDSPVRELPALLVSTSVGVLEVLHFEDRQIVHQVNLEFPYSCAVNGVLDLLPEPGPEVVVTDKSGRTVILDGDLAPLAQIMTSPMAWRGAAGTLTAVEGQRELFRVGVREGTVSFRAVPVTVNLAYPVLAIVVVISLAVVAMLWLGLRYRRRHLDPNIKREVRLHLLESLQLSRHGDIAPLNAVRRLNFCLRALKSDIGDTSRLRIRLDEILTECQEASLPHLTGITDRARLADIDSHLIRAAGQDLTTVRRLVQKLAGLEDLLNPSEQLVNDLDKAEKDAERHLRKMRLEVAGYFQADPGVALERVLAANQERLREAGIQMGQEKLAMAAAGGSIASSIEPAAGNSLPEGTCCQIDMDDLVVVLDNVIANATSAMRNSAVKELSLTQNLVDGMVLIDVKDTGCGIAHENQDRALNTHYTTKIGGGTGLPASRKILRRYSGQISILRSEPGRGTTIRITTIAS